MDGYDRAEMEAVQKAVAPLCQEFATYLKGTPNFAEVFSSVNLKPIEAAALTVVVEKIYQGNAVALVALGIWLGRTRSATLCA